MRRLGLALFLAVVAVAAGSIAVDDVTRGRDGTSPQAAATAVLSPRRIPSLVSRAIGDSRLRSALDAALDEPALGDAREHSCLVVEDEGRVIYSRNPNQPLVPASTMKVLTAHAAMHELGPEERFTTHVRAQTGPVEGVVDGPIWLVGAGDPLIATADYVATFANQPQVFTPFEQLADAILGAGVREVRGGVIGDESRFDAQRYVPTWRTAYITASEIGPVSALVVNDNFSSFGPIKKIAAVNPALHAASVLTRLLRDRGLIVGEPSRGLASSKSVAVASVSSPPVREIVGEMLRESDNLTAEVLVKEMGVRSGRGGTWTDGLAAVREALAEADLPIDGFAAVDASGLDRSDRATCGLLSAALTTATGSFAIDDGFPIAGRTGTLAERFVDSPIAGRLRAKTGSLDFVVGLTGYVDASAGKSLTFSFLANDLPSRDLAFGRAVQERVATILASYPEAPPPAHIGPR